MPTMSNEPVNESPKKQHSRNEVERPDQPAEQSGLEPGKGYGIVALVCVFVLGVVSVFSYYIPVMLYANLGGVDGVMIFCAIAIPPLIGICILYVIVRFVFGIIGSKTVKDICYRVKTEKQYGIISLLNAMVPGIALVFGFFVVPHMLPDGHGKGMVALGVIIILFSLSIPSVVVGIDYGIKGLKTEKWYYARTGLVLNSLWALLMLYVFLSLSL
jgi:hypothetical protein